MKYKLLVLDVDGTLLNDEREISKRTLAALLKVQHGTHSSGTVRDFHPIPFSSASPDRERGTKRGQR